MMDIFTSFFNALGSFFWCEKGVDSVLCAGLLQARVLGVVGALLLIVLWRIGSAIKRSNGFKEGRFIERRKAFAKILQQHLQLIGQMADHTSELLPLNGPLSPEQWKNRATLPEKLQSELDKLSTIIAKYNFALRKQAAEPKAPAAELSARPIVEAPKPVAELKKQLAKCQKMATAV